MRKCVQICALVVVGLSLCCHTAMAAKQTAPYFNGNVTGVHPVNTYIMAYFSKILYPAHIHVKPQDQKAFVTKFSAMMKAEGWQQTVVYHDDKTGTDLAVLFNPTTFLVLFRGTERAGVRKFYRDLATNFRVTMPRVTLNKTRMRIHRGFWKSYRSVRTRLLQLAKKQRGTRKVWISGHSLGGALSHIAALDFVGNGIPVQQVVTFGSPRIGNVQFQQAYKKVLLKQTVRINNEDDFIAFIPGRTLRYRHAAPAFGLYSDGTVNPHANKQSTCVRPFSHVGYHVYTWRYLQRAGKQYQHLLAKLPTYPAGKIYPRCKNKLKKFFKKVGKKAKKLGRVAKNKTSSLAGRTKEKLKKLFRKKRKKRR
jgi:hypothetical protein